MGIPLNPQLITAGKQINVSLPNPNFVNAVLISNKTVLDLQVGGMDLSGTQWQAAGVENIYLVESSNQGIVTLQGFNTANITNPPTGVILITLFLKDEKIPEGKWPATIPSQNVNIVNTSTLQIINDGNPAGTTIVEATQKNAPSSDVFLDNTGNFLLAEYVNNAMLNVLQVIVGTGLKLGNTSRLVEILGSLAVDGNSTHTGATNLVGPVTATNQANNINASQLNGIFQAGDDNSNGLSELLTATNRGLAIVTNDGTNNHEVPILDKAGNTLLTVPGGKVTSAVANATNATNASNVPATGVTAGTFTSGVIIPGAQVNGNITGNTSGNSGSSNYLNNSVSGFGNFGGQLGKANPGDVLDASGGVTGLKSTGSTNGLALIAPGGLLLTSGMKIGNSDTAQGNLLDWGGSTGNPVYVKSLGGGLVFQASNVTKWSRSQEGSFTGSGSGTYNHNAGGVPDYITATVNVAGSSTMGYDSLTSTQAHITMGSSLSFKAEAKRY